jgi:hypothetical protein
MTDAMCVPAQGWHMTQTYPPYRAETLESPTVAVQSLILEGFTAAVTELCALALALVYV